MKAINEGVDVSEVFTIVICCIMYVYEEPKVTFEIPYKGTAVLADPPIAVTDI